MGSERRRPVTGSVRRHFRKRAWTSFSRLFSLLNDCPVCFGTMGSKNSGRVALVSAFMHGSAGAGRELPLRTNVGCLRLIPLDVASAVPAGARLLPLAPAQSAPKSHFFTPLVPRYSPWMVCATTWSLTGRYFCKLLAFKYQWTRLGVYPAWRVVVG